MKKCLFIIIMLLSIMLVIDTNAISLKNNITDNMSILDASGECSYYFGNASDSTSLMHLLKYQVFRPIQIITPILLLFLTTADFAKVVFDPAKDGLNKAKKNFVKRGITAIVVFLVPYLLTLIFEIVDNAAIRSCLGNF